MTLEAVKLDTVFEPPTWDREHWEILRNRLADANAQGYSMTRIAIETKPKPDQNSIRRHDYTAKEWENCIDTWAKDGSLYRQPGRGFNEPSMAEKIETALSAWFEDLDKRNTENPPEPSFVLTSVARNIIGGFEDAREMKKLVEIETPPGSGKTFTTAHYLAQRRKAAGFDCPVWSITLRETNCAMRHILLEIAQSIQIRNSQFAEGPQWENGEYALSNQIADMAAVRDGGLLIVDEAQNLFGHLKGATNRHGLNILNELRRFTNAGLFGIALLGNGEILRHAKAQRSTQLAILDMIAIVAETLQTDAGSLEKQQGGMRS